MVEEMITLRTEIGLVNVVNILCVCVLVCKQNIVHDNQ